jgi:uncharacterized protein (TIGR00369 family)
MMRGLSVRGAISLDSPPATDPVSDDEGPMEKIFDVTDFHFDMAFTIVEQQETRVVAKMPVHQGMLNPFGTIHAGAMIWFADVAATRLARIAGQSTTDAKGFPLAINIQAAVLSNQRGGELIADARFLRQGKRVMVVRTTVTGEDGKLLLELTTTHVPAATGSS